MVKSKLHAAFLVAGTLAAGCTEAVTAQEIAPTSEPAPASGPAPVPAPAAKADEPTRPAPQRPIDEGAIRALAEEVARLRSQLAELQAAKQTPAPSLVEPVRPGETPASPEPEPRFGSTDGESAAGGELEREVPVYVEREVPVYVDREVPVYVDREIVVERPTTVVLERVVYGDHHCDQWIPFRHVHSIGCGHHYYGCSCHPWYYDLGPTFSLNFSYVHVDDDRDHDHRGRGDRGGRDDRRSDHDSRDGRVDRSDQRPRADGAGSDHARNGPDRSPRSGRPGSDRGMDRSDSPRGPVVPAPRPIQGRSSSADAPVRPPRPERDRDDGADRRPQRQPEVTRPPAGPPQARAPRDTVRAPRERAPEQLGAQRRVTTPPQRPERRPDAVQRPGRSNDAPPPPPPPQRHKKKS